MSSLSSSVKFLIGFVALGIGVEASAQAHVPPVMNLSEAQCIATMANRCILRSEHRTFEMISRREEGLVAVMKPSTGDASRDAFALQRDLAERINRGDLTSDEAMVVSSELASFEGAAYTLPTVDELKAALGFPAESDFNNDDLRDLMRAHLQLTLGVGPLTASYLYDRLGVESADYELKPINGFEATASLELPARSSRSFADDLVEEIKPNRN